MTNGIKKSHKCPLDGRLFATKRALAQHEQAVHQKPVQSGNTRRPNRAKRSKTVSSKAECRRVSGSDVLGSYTIKKEAKAGDVIVAFPITPDQFPNTRMHYEAQLYTRWKPISLRFEVIPAASTMYAGAYAVGWTADPDTWITSSRDSITTISAFTPSVHQPIHAKGLLTVPNKTIQKWFLVDQSQEVADTTHGKVFIILTSELANLSGGSSTDLLVRLHWTVEFDSPTVPVSVEKGNHIYATAGYESYFTDSVSDWAEGKFLTLKATKGGTAVTFMNTVPGGVYELDPTAKLTYKPDDKPIKYGVPIKNYLAGTNLAMFETLSNARNFARTNDTRYCIPFSAAGAVVTPSNPAWQLIQSSNVASSSGVVQELWREIDLLRKELRAVKLTPEVESFLGPTWEQIDS